MTYSHSFFYTATSTKSSPRGLRAGVGCRVPARRVVTRHPELRKTNARRTLDHRLLFYNCGKVHIYRRFPSRQGCFPGFSTDALRPLPGQRPGEIENYLSQTSRALARVNRLPSTYKYTSPTTAATLTSEVEGPQPKKGKQKQKVLEVKLHTGRKMKTVQQCKDTHNTMIHGMTEDLG